MRLFAYFTTCANYQIKAMSVFIVMSMFKYISSMLVEVIIVVVVNNTNTVNNLVYNTKMVKVRFSWRSRKPWWKRSSWLRRTR